jgi:hypothetical protein
MPANTGGPGLVVVARDPFRGLGPGKRNGTLECFPRKGFALFILLILAIPAFSVTDLRAGAPISQPASFVGAHGPANPSAGVLHVNVTSETTTTSTAGGQLVFLANVQSAGVNVPGATVAFSDTFGSTFAPATTTTNSTGWGITMATFPTYGSDVVTASASLSGYTSGAGSLTIPVSTASSTQLVVAVQLANAQASGGSENVVYGTVTTENTDPHTPIGGATVTVLDTAGSTNLTTVQTGSDGSFWIPFDLAASPVSLTDLITATATETGDASSSSTIFGTITPYGGTDLSVSMVFNPSMGSTPGGYTTVLASVTNGARPLQGVSVDFRDTLGGTFSAAPASTNSTGWAIVGLHFATGNSGQDVLTAMASINGYSDGIASTVMPVAPYSATQLTVYLYLANSQAAGGSEDLVYGTVDTANTDPNTPIAGATVTVTDSGGSSNFVSAETDSNGAFWIPFDLANKSDSFTDLISATATDTGFTSSSSTVFGTITPYGGADLSVNMLYLPTDGNTPGGFTTVLASVTNGAVPVSGADVTFTETLGGAFDPSSGTTNSTGWAVVELNLSNANSGEEIFTATASLSGYTDGIASTAMLVAAYSSTQLTVYLYVQDPQTAGGGVDAVYGSVDTANTDPNTPIADASVVVSDTFGSSLSVQTSANGSFQVDLTLPVVTAVLNDIVSATAQLAGFSSSTSSIPLLVTPGTASLSSVSVSPISASVAVGGSQEFFALASCNGGGCPANVDFSWSAANGLGVLNATIGSSVLFTAGPTSGIDALFVNATLNGVTEQSSAVQITLLGMSGGARYQVAFTESGLPSGTFWSVNLAGVQNGSSSSMIAFSEPNETYTFSVQSLARYTASPATGTILVNGADVTRQISFGSTVSGSYVVTFTESGLPSGTNWGVTLNGTTLRSAGASIVFDEPNETYSFSVESVEGYVANPQSGSLIIQGAPEAQSIEFNQTGVSGSASSTFSALGLPTWEGYALIAGCSRQ